MSGRFLEQIVQALTQGQRRLNIGAEIKDWRVALTQSQLVSVGIKHNQGGSVYAPPAYKKSESADVFVIWDDGKCSKVKANPALQAGARYWDDELRNWRLAAFTDPYAAVVPEPAGVPEVDIADETIHDVINRQNEKVFEQQAWILDAHPPQAHTNGNIAYYWGENDLYTSTGIAAHYADSRYALSWSFDSIVADGIARRYLPQPEFRGALWQESVAKYEIMQSTAPDVNAATTVVLSPAVVEQIINQYILSNFRGENILDGQSKFSRDDFSAGLRLFADELSVEINALEPRAWGSYRLTSEGVPAKQTTLVQDGALLSPFLNLKDSRRWGDEPTAMPAGPAGIILKHRQPLNWTDCLRGIKDGVLILSVLGLHTQNPVQGNFSLAAPAALRILDGVPVGKTDVRINGNIWDVFNDKATYYAAHDLYSHPYMLVRCCAEKL